MADIVLMQYIEIPQEVTNENAITLVYYLAQQKTVIPCGMLTFLIEAFCLLTNVYWVKQLLP